MKTVLKLTFLLLIPFISKSNHLDEFGCFTRNQVLKMQSAPAEKVGDFLYKENWQNDRALNNLTGFFGYELKYNLNYWTHPYFPDRSVSLYSAALKSNILIIQTNQACFNELLYEFNNLKLVTTSKDGYVIRRGKIDNLVVEFQEIYDEEGEKFFYLLVYNPATMKSELDALKKKDAELKKTQLERETRIASLTQQGDSLFEASQFEAAKTKYLALLTLESNDEISLKIEECEKNICLIKVKEGVKMMENENFQMAIDYFNKIKDCADKHVDESSNFNVDVYIDQCKNGICNQDVKAGDAFFALNKYNQAIEKYNDAKKCLTKLLGNETNLDIDQKIYQAKKALLLIEIGIGDSLYIIDQYDAAIKKYIASRSFGIEDKLIDNKIKQVQEATLKKQISELTLEAQEQLSSNSYSKALVTYKKIQNLSPYNSEVSKKVKELEEILSVLELRKKTVLSYKEVDKASFKTLQNKLIDLSIDKINATNNGNLELDIQIKFDTAGKNKTELSKFVGLKSSEEKELKTWITNELPAPIKGQFFFAAKDNLSLNLNWSTDNFKEKTRKNPFYTYSEFPEINTFIQNQTEIKHAKYSFELKKVKIESSNLDMKNQTTNLFYVTKCKTPGPGNVFYSMLLPGVGTMRVTQGQKGATKMILFILSSATAYYANELSKENQIKYQNATNTADYNKYYGLASDYSLTALYSAGFSTILYIHDFFWVIKKGKSNRRDARNLNSQISNGKLLINQVDLLK